MSAAIANTTAAIVDPPGVSTVSATTSTGMSRIRPRVSAFGRFSGNKRNQATRRCRARYSSPAVLPTGPSGETVAASSGQGKVPRFAP